MNQEEKDVADIEPCGFSDPNGVESDLKQIFRNEPYYDKLIFIPQRKMPVFLSSDNPTSYLRISMDMLLLTPDEQLDLYTRIGQHYDFQIVTVVRIPKGKPFEEVLEEIADHLQGIPRMP